MLASFSIVPVGSGERFKELVADFVQIVERSGLEYRLGAMQTTVEGDEDQVMSVIMECHQFARRSATRVLTHIAIDDREGASGRLTGKVTDVENFLQRKVHHE